MLKLLLYFSFATLVLTSCTTLQNGAKYDLADGKYRLKTGGQRFNCYVKNTTDSIKIYNYTTKVFTYLTPETYSPINQRFIKPSFDIDVLTALFKIRPPSLGILPTQLNTNLNGSIYMGHRTDVYHIQYKKNSLDMYQRQINHFGFSSGLFVGLGNTAMTPSTTNNAISVEYDGIILQKGIAAILAINKLTIGLGFGLDTLMDKYKHEWIYQNKPWFGLMFGLNLN
jgi:hypothetical protein